MKDLEHANFVHANILRVVAVAIYAFIIQDVKNPPPELFLSNPDAFESPRQFCRGDRSPQVSAHRWDSVDAVPTRCSTRSWR